ncbi:hypothetical protein [Shewanella violacea]|uniref:Uncharacterized protein n=1 Tax=Shewanella violacea (strain JCM 10179 / CIP 106290 / LMG 19151 / DSS12) TaxID=637905 RepID=D4ZFU4_SHEVD|nr:hypothetical protein [Shewanella violacea]BAJ00543.1 hypothetical protein SVI_0572 [Shewanella violacea DSS12]
MEIKPKPQPANEPLKRFPQLDNRELVKTSFWISQVFMIIATIVGVYLAAQEGLSQALAFDNLTNKQNNYYLRHALYDEVSDNVNIINDYADLISETSPHDIKAVHPSMATFIWDNMRFSAYTLETPTKILSETRRFYMGADEIITKVETRFYGAKFGAEQLKKLTIKVSEQTLPSLKENYLALALELKQAKIIVE